MVLEVAGDDLSELRPELEMPLRDFRLEPPPVRCRVMRVGFPSDVTHR